MATLPALPALLQRGDALSLRKGFTAREARILRSLAAAAMPQGTFLEGGGDVTVKRLERWLEGAKPMHWAGIRGFLWTAELAALPFTGHTLSALPRERAARFLESWAGMRSPRSRAILRAILSPVKAAHFDDPKMRAHVGCRTLPTAAPVQLERPRWLEQVTDGSSALEDLELECEVVIVGTGAGGAACAYELASRGRAVLMLEEGRYHRRDSFNSHPTQMTRKLYRDQGLTVAFGNAYVPVWAGRGVGGSTTINSGTCYRAPERVLRKWRDEGLAWFSSESLGPYYERVESMLQVTRAKMDLTGGVGRVVQRGADRLGYSNAPLMRNAPDCDGQGVCCFGCPTGAKRSTDVSYVPEALKRGAQLVTSAKVTGIDLEGGRARGVHARLASGKTLRVRAEAVVVAGGLLMTPLVLGKTLRKQDARANLSIPPRREGHGRLRRGHRHGYRHPAGLHGRPVPGRGPDVRGRIDTARHHRGRRAVGGSALHRAHGSLPEGRHVRPDDRRYLARPRARRPVRLAHPHVQPEHDRHGEDVPGHRHPSELSSLRAPAACIRSSRAWRSWARLPTSVPCEPEAAPRRFEVTAYHPLGTCRIGVDPEDERARAGPPVARGDGALRHGRERGADAARRESADDHHGDGAQGGRGDRLAAVLNRGLVAPRRKISRGSTAPSGRTRSIDLSSSMSSSDCSGQVRRLRHANPVLAAQGPAELDLSPASAARGTLSIFSLSESSSHRKFTWRLPSPACP